MLIEHPEDGIHRGLSRQVFSRLKSRHGPGQIIATSHSELVFDMLDPSEVRLISMVDGETKGEGHLTPERSAARGITLTNLAGSPSYLEINEQFMRSQGPLAFGILGEDESDKKTIHALLKEITGNPSLSCKGQGFGGCGDLLNRGARVLKGTPRRRVPAIHHLRG